jgi:hypothetical protein
MKYAVLMYTRAEETKAMTTDELGWIAAKHEELRGDVRASGELVGGDGLALPEETKTLRLVDGRVAATTGPLVDSAEQMSAYYLLECAGLDRALEIAERVLDFHVVAAEVRRIHDSA